MPLLSIFLLSRPLPFSKANLKSKASSTRPVNYSTIYAYSSAELTLVNTEQENDRLSKELTSTKRKISNLQSDLAAARREASASGSGTLNVPSGSR